MGEFDKRQTPDTGAEKKKLMILGTLGAVLVALVSIHFLKGGPQAAQASAIPEPGASPVTAMDETPAQAQAALADDPTATLLRGTPTAHDPLLDRTPHNPFLLSSEWRSQLVHPAEVRVVHNRVVYTAPTPQSVDVEKYKLSGILRQNNALCAIVNGRVVTAGMTLEDVKVVEITPDRVVLQRADSPNGPTADLTIDPKL
ncbi:MAG: hypothetical protein ACTHN5_10585 [Phycisphaerae bacterium]